MLRCTIELLPGGDATRARTVGVVEVALLDVDDANRGTYAVVLKKTPPFTGALRHAWRRGRLTRDETRAVGCEPGEDDDAVVARVAGHHRTRRGAYDLLYRALRACGLEARNPE